LRLDNSGAANNNNNNRIAAGSPINLSGGALDFVGNGSVSGGTQQQVGALTPQVGASPRVVPPSWE
jgi:hypothetical protein